MSSRMLQICRYALAAGLIFLAGRVSSGIFATGHVPLPSVSGAIPQTTIDAPIYGSAPARHRSRPAAARAAGARTQAQPIHQAPKPGRVEPSLATHPLPAAAAVQPQTPPGTGIAGDPGGQSQFVAVTDGACGACRVTQTADGAIRAQVEGARSDHDSAYGLLDFGGPDGLGGAVFVADKISLGIGQVPTADLQVLQVADRANRIVYRAVIAANSRLLHVESPPGGLSADPLDVDTGIVVPNDGSSLALRIQAQAGNVLDVQVNGRDVALRTDLHGATSGPQRYLGAGIIATAGPAAAAALVSVAHAALSVAAKPPTPSAPAPRPTLAPAAPVTVVAPSAVQPPTVSGVPVEGATLASNPGAWSDSGATLSTRWQRCDANGDSCTTVGSGSSFTATNDDVGSTLRAVVTATNSAGSSTAYSALTAPVAAAAPTPAAPALQTSPTISGTPAVGSTLSADAGTWTDADTFAYAWQRCDTTGACAAIDGATAATYALGSADAGSTIVVLVTASGAGGSTTAASAATGLVIAVPVLVDAPTLSGDATVGGTLTASAGTWSDPSAAITYSWQRCDATGACATVDGATGSAYTVADADAGATITVTVTATNAAGSASATASVNVAAPPPPPPAPPPAPPAPTPAPPAPTPDDGSSSGSATGDANTAATPTPVDGGASGDGGSVESGAAPNGDAATSP